MQQNSSLKKLFSQTAIYGVSSTLAKFLNYLLTPFLTRVLSDSTYGEVSYMYAIIPFVNVLLTLGFSTGYFRFAARCEGIKEQKTLFTTLWSSVSLFALILCGGWAIINPEPMTLAMLVLILVDNIAAMPLSLLRQQRKAGLYTLANLLGVLINVAMCYYLYVGGEGTRESGIWVLVANIVASVTSLLIILPTCIKWVNNKIDWRVFRKVAKFSVPLMIAGIMGVGSDFIDKLMINWMLPQKTALAEVGIYSAVAKIAALMVLFRQVYTLGAEPFFLQKFKDGDFAKLSAQALKYFTAVGTIILLVLVLYSDLFALIIGKNLRGGIGLLPILALANLMAGVLVNLSFWYKVVDKTKYAMIVTLSGITVSIGVNLLLIPQFGYAGAGWGRLISTIVMVTICYTLGQKHCPVKYDKKAIALYTGMGAAIYIISLYTNQMDNQIIRWTTNTMLISAFCTIFVAKEKLYKIIKK